MSHSVAGADSVSHSAAGEYSVSHSAALAAWIHRVLRAVPVPGMAVAAALAVALASLAVLPAAPAPQTIDARALTANDETPAITWADPADIVYGTPLGGTQLNAAASVPGTFAYTPGAGTVLPAGAGQTLHVDFVPEDSAGYGPASADVTINVQAMEITVSADAGSKTYGDPDPALTYQVVSGSMVGSDAFNGALAREAGEDAGSYDIYRGTLALSDNYHLAFDGAGAGGGEAGIDTPVCVGPGRVYRLRFSGSISGPSESGSRIAEHGSSSLYLYWEGEADGASPPHVCVTQGDRVQHLGPLTDAVYYSNRICWVDESDFLVITGGYNGTDPDLAVMRYHVGDGTISLVGTARFGNSASRYLDMIKLQSGAMVMCWFQRASFVETPLYFSYTMDGLTWQTLASSVTPGYQGQYKGALCQHPADGSLWFFGHGDSFHNMNGYRLVESAGTLSLDWADPMFITGTGPSGSELEPDPEYPCIVAIPDDAAGTILLAYQRGADHVRWYWDGARWSLDPAGFVTYVLVSKVAVVDVQADGTCALRTVVDQYVERISPFGIGLLPDGRLWFVGLSCDQSRTPQRMQRLVALTVPDYERLYLQGENESPSDFVCSGDEVLYEAGDNSLFSLAWPDANGGEDDAGDVVGTFTIVPRHITVTAHAQGKAYGAADPALTYSWAPALTGGDSFSGSLSRVAGEDAGSYAIHQGTLSLSGNYTITFTGATLTIAPPVLTITTISPLQAGTVGAAYSQTLTASGGTAPCAWSIDSGTLPDGLALNPATGEISGTPTTAGGPVTITFRVTDSVSGSATVDLSITVAKGTTAVTWANPDDIVYGTALDGTQLDAAASVPGGFVYTPASGTLLNAGNGQTLHVDFTPADTANYNTASADVTINVSPLGITVTADAQGKTYGEADPALTYTCTPSLTGSAGFSGSLTREAGEDAGAYAITLGTLSLPANYTLTYVGANFTISPPPLAITAASRLPDGRVGEAYYEALTATGGVSTYTWSVDSGALPDGLTLAADGAISGTPTTAGGDSSITFRVTDGVATSATVVLPIMIARGTPVVTWGSPDAIVYGSALGGGQLGAAASVPGEFVYTPAAGTRLDAGSGRTLHVDFTPTDAANYNAASAEVSITVVPRAVTVTAGALSKTYGDPDPAFAHRVSSGSVVSGDAFSGALARQRGEDVGAYAILQGTLSLSANYRLTFVEGTLRIDARDITVTPDDRNKAFGETVVFAGSEFTVDGLLEGDTITSVTLASAGANGAALAGTYGILAGDAVGEGLENYTITCGSGTLTVARASPFVGLTCSSGSERLTGSAPVVLVATVAGPGATGTVTFKDGETPLMSASLVNGNVTCTLSSLPSGIHSITAVYSGDANFAGSISAPLAFTVEAASGSSRAPVAAALGAAAVGLLFVALRRAR